MDKEILRQKLVEILNNYDGSIVEGTQFKQNDRFCSCYEGDMDNVFPETRDKVVADILALLEKSNA